jgi:hypothetical protein
VEIGKRYRCDSCGTEVLVTRVGDGEPSCCTVLMILSKPKDLPSAD